VTHLPPTLTTTLLPQPSALTKASEAFFALSLPGAFQGDHGRRDLPGRAALIR
jgi:hypothetical protein